MFLELGKTNVAAWLDSVLWHTGNAPTLVMNVCRPLSLLGRRQGLSQRGILPKMKLIISLYLKCFKELLSKGSFSVLLAGNQRPPLHPPCNWLGHGAWNPGCSSWP